MNKELEQLEKLTVALGSELAAYKEKPTKASSKRIRMVLGDIKKNTSSFRSILVGLDKSGDY